jgi:RNA polymerase sigma-70 factor (ECF subfamily)
MHRPKLHAGRFRLPSRHNSGEEPMFSEKRAIVRTALAQIPNEQREAIELAFFSGLTHEEIAMQLATPLGTIKARIRRGLLRLKHFVMEAR